MTEMSSIIERYRGEQVRLEQRVIEIETQYRELSQEFSELEQRHSDLMAFYVLISRLHVSLNRDEVIQTIYEILGSLIGCEEVALFERRDGENTLNLVSSIGIDPAPWKEVDVRSGLIGRAVSTGNVCSRWREPSLPVAVGESDLTACVPLICGEIAIGAIAMFRLLPQQRHLGDKEHEMMEILGRHAAMALYCASLHATTPALNFATAVKIF